MLCDIYIKIPNLTRICEARNEQWDLNITILCYIGLFCDFLVCGWQSHVCEKLLHFMIPTINSNFWSIFIASSIKSITWNNVNLSSHNSSISNKISQQFSSQNKRNNTCHTDNKYCMSQWFPWFIWLHEIVINSTDYQFYFTRVLRIVLITVWGWICGDGSFSEF